MNLKQLCLITLASTVLTACGGDSGDDNPQPTPEPEPTPTSTPSPTATPTPTPEPDTAWTCPTDDSLYFCDDFEDGTYLDKWDDLISGYALSSTGKFDVLDEGQLGKSLRFTAGTRGDTIDLGELITVKDTAFANVPGADYFVEYRIRPRDNSNTGPKYLFAMARYEEAKKFYTGGLNMQGASTSTAIAAGWALPSDTTKYANYNKLVNKKTPLLLGAKGGTDGIWYVVRMELIGNVISMYLNGVKVDEGTDTANLYTTKGKIGFMTYNRSFEIDWVKVGDPSVKPVALTLDYTDPTWQSAVGGDTLDINVTAIQSDGTSADTFTAVSSDSDILSVAIVGNKVTLTPVAQGSAVVTFTAGSDPSVKRVIEVLVEPSWEMPTTDYGDVSDVVTPLAGEGYVDSTLTIEFDTDSTLVLSTTGEVRIFDTNDVLVDRIKVAQETEYVGYKDQQDARILKTQLITIDNNTLRIKPHSQALNYGTEYKVAIGTNVVTGAKLKTKAFDGLGINSAWTFTTKAKPEATVTSLNVDATGAGADFRSVQGALDWVMETAAADTAFASAPFTINVAQGVYDGLYYLAGKNNLTIKGENAANSAKGDVDIYATAGKTVIQGENNAAINIDRYLFLAKGVDLLTFDSLTLRNNADRSGQAEALRFNSPGRFIATNAQFISEQDTLWLSGYNWFYNSLVAGNVDFIWGNSVAAVFESCEIRTVGDSKFGANSSGKGGYLLQARAGNSTDPGYVFLDSELTYSANAIGTTVTTGSTYLARSGGKPDYFDNIAFINTKMGTHIADIGFAYKGVESQPGPNPVTATADSGWREFNSMDAAGTALDMSKRCDNGDANAVPTSCYRLSQDEVDTRFCSSRQIFASYNTYAGWDPKGEGIADGCAIAQP